MQSSDRSAVNLRPNEIPHFGGSFGRHLCAVLCTRAIDPHDYAPHSLPHAQEAQVVVTDVEAHITGTVWKIEVEVGDSVEEGDTVVILESMKMEMPVEAEDPGVVTEIRCEEGQSVAEGDTLVVLE
jgi:acetyl-CoA carboxylase biotin carboxyl carrier protein